jgi:GT2 family glycosyltransferase
MKPMPSSPSRKSRFVAWALAALPAPLSARIDDWRKGPQVSKDDIIIIVLNWNRADDTITCLESLAQADLGNAHVLVVDNGSRDDSVAAIRRRFPAQDVLPLPENRGYAGGNNAGIEVALAKGAGAVLLLNNDTRVAPDFLDPLVWAMNSGRKVAAVSSAILRMERPEILDAAYMELHYGHGIVHRRGVNALPGEGFDECRSIEVAIGCSLLIKAGALSQVGLFDESYFAYHEEVDWCVRARKAGFDILYQPLSRVWHAGSKSTESLARTVTAPRVSAASGPQLPNPIPLSWNPVRSYLGARNTVRFIRKHATVRQKLRFLTSSMYEVPLELLAAVLRQEDALKIGSWTYGRALRLACVLNREHTSNEGAPRRVLSVLRSLLWSLPQEVRRASREGRTAQVREHVRGLWDGVKNRPLPLERLKLR